jgi:predicted 3-demethylubiquinone-9 3-methyltransferase (glyoxalase superfamily)
MKRITPFLWFDDNAEEAVKFYRTVFKKSKVRRIARYSKSGEKAAGRPAGSVMTIEFELDGQEFVALNGGPHIKFNEAVSFVVPCKTQAEVDYYWKKLSAGGKEIQCGWLKDKFGVHWQIVPTVMFDFLNGKDRVKSERAFGAMLQMVKLDIKKLKDAFAGKTK